MNNIGSNCTQATRTVLAKTLALGELLMLFALAFAFGQASPCFAQLQDHNSQTAPEQSANMNGPSRPASGANAAEEGNVQNSTPAPSKVGEPDVSEITKELEVMRARIDQLERELKTRAASPAPAAAQQDPVATSATADQQPPAASKGTPAAKSEKAAPAEPFAYADW